MILVSMLKMFRSQDQQTSITHQAGHCTNQQNKMVAFCNRTLYAFSRLIQLERNQSKVEQTKEKDTKAGHQSVTSLEQLNCDKAQLARVALSYFNVKNA